MNTWHRHTSPMRLPTLVLFFPFCSLPFHSHSIYPGFVVDIVFKVEGVESFVLLLTGVKV